MLLDCDVSEALGYTSKLQIARVLSENWFERNGYCLACDGERLSRTTANSKASDFVCFSCDQTYELKSFRRKPHKSLVDGAYAALISRIQSGSVPTLMLLERNDEWKVMGLTALHPMFLTSEVIEKRKPLSETARRAGWVGCNIRLDLMAPDAQIHVVENRVPRTPALVRESFRRFDRLETIAPSTRGWATLTLRIVRSLGRQQFSLDEVYAKEFAFASAYPANNNIRAKVRQQLQVLRDLSFVEFLGQGTYKLLI